MLSTTFANTFGLIVIVLSLRSSDGGRTQEEGVKNSKTKTNWTILDQNGNLLTITGPLDILKMNITLASLEPKEKKGIGLDPPLKPNAGPGPGLPFAKFNESISDIKRAFDINTNLKGKPEPERLDHAQMFQILQESIPFWILDKALEGPLKMIAVIEGVYGLRLRNTKLDTCVNEYYTFKMDLEKQDPVYKYCILQLTHERMEKFKNRSALSKKDLEKMFTLSTTCGTSLRQAMVFLRRPLYRVFYQSFQCLLRQIFETFKMMEAENYFGVMIKDIELHLKEIHLLQKEFPHLAHSHKKKLNHTQLENRIAEMKQLKGEKKKLELQMEKKAEWEKEIKEFEKAIRGIPLIIVGGWKEIKEMNDYMRQKIYRRFLKPKFDEKAESEKSRLSKSKPEKEGIKNGAGGGGVFNDFVQKLNAIFELDSKNEKDKDVLEKKMKGGELLDLVRTFRSVRKLVVKVSDLMWSSNAKKLFDGEQESWFNKIFKAKSTTFGKQCGSSPVHPTGSCTVENHEVCTVTPSSENPRDFQSILFPLKRCQCGFNLKCLSVSKPKKLKRRKRKSYTLWQCKLFPTSEGECRGGNGYPCKTFPLAPGEHDGSCLSGKCDMNMRTCKVLPKRIDDVAVAGAMAKEGNAPQMKWTDVGDIFFDE